MAAQQGFVYEVNATNFLRNFDLVPANFTPAGAGHDQPDLMIQYQGKQAGVELKISMASAGSLVLKHNIADKKNPWGFNPIPPTDDEKQFLADLAYEIKLFDQIKRKWKGTPAKFLPAGNHTKREVYEMDKKAYPDILLQVPSTKIEEYYNKKKTYYVNVGTHGFYLLGSRNPLGLKQVPRFGTAAKAKARTRVQYKGSGNYQFTFEMQFSISGGNKSPYNIAPVNGKTVEIDIDAADLTCFIGL